MSPYLVDEGVGSVLPAPSTPRPRIKHDKRAHVYTLRYHGAAPDETVRASHPTLAVKRRKASILPSGITDETIMRRWLDRTVNRG